MIPIAGRSVLTAEQMRAAEREHGDLAGLMQRAGEAIAHAARRLAAGSEVLVLCGPGNNGGDGYVAACTLAAKGHPVRIVASGEPKSDLAHDARARWSGPVEALADAAPAPILIDALFGTGLSRPLGAAIERHLRRLSEQARLTIAVDLPSGVATDDGAILGEPPEAQVTLALAALKPAHLLQPAARLCGSVRVVDIGLGTESDVQAIDRPDLPTPGPDSYKYTRGMVAVVPGAMAGAATLASIAAMRAGAGYVLLLDGGEGAPHALVRQPFAPERLRNDKIGAIVIGPGLGRDDAAKAKLDVALASGRPLVVDGDALHLTTPEELAALDVPLILTPHVGEFNALFGKGQGSKIDRARDAARRSGAVVAFKGADTVIAAPDGRVRIAGEASVWLSTAGSGDTLAGTTGAMLAAGLDPVDAAAAAVWLNGEAARRLGASFIADDLAHAITAARAGL